MDLGTWHELAQLAEGYAAGADLDDEELFASVFLPDARLSVHDVTAGTTTPERVGVESLRRIPAQLAAKYDGTFHVIANRRYWDEGEGAAGEILCVAHHLDRTAGTDHVMHIRYRDTYGRHPDGRWGIATRRLRVLFRTTGPIDPAP